VKEKTLLFIASYDGSQHDSESGVLAYQLNHQTGRVNQVDIQTSCPNPSYLAFDRVNDMLYATNDHLRNSFVSAYKFDRNENSLIFKNSIELDGKWPCHLDVCQERKLLAIANYFEGNVSFCDLSENGCIKKLSRTIKKSGKGIHPRQDCSHSHAAAFAPDGKWLLVPDLGLDTLMSYCIDKMNADYSRFDFPSATGPRHIVFHPNGKWLYVITELSNEVYVFDYCNGKVAYKQKIKLLPQSYQGESTASAIKITSDGKFLYGATRGFNQVVCFAVMADGLLEKTGYFDTAGKNTRDFALVAEDKFAVFANQDSNNIAIFARNQKNGAIEELIETRNLHSPQCICAVLN